MKGHLGAVLTSGLTAIAVAFMVLFAIVVARPASAPSAPYGYAAPGRSIPWSPAPKAADPPRERDVKPREREYHLPPPRNNRLDQGPHRPRKSAA